MTEHDERRLTEPEPHPEELLAEYVEGALSGAEMRKVQRHLDSCSICQEEVRLARRARTGVTTLPPEEVPVGLTRSVVDRARSRRERSPVWVWGSGAAAVAAAAAAVILFVVLHGGSSGGVPAAARSALSAPGNAGAGGETAGRPVPIQVSSTDYDPAKIQTLAGQLVSGSDRTLSRSVAPTLAPQGGAPTGSGPEFDSGKPAICIRSLAQPTHNDTLIEIIVARFQGTPAYIAPFDHRPAPGEPPDLLAIWVGSRDGCRLLHYASQPIG